MAWPWEMFQRVPGVGVTLVKVCGAALIVLVGAQRARDRRFPRTGLEAPLCVFAAACLVSAMHSLDPRLSVAELKTLLSYLVLFYAVACATAEAEDAAAVARAFAVSAMLVGLLALACAAGWAAPAIVSATRQLGRRITTDMRAGALMRMAATTPDFNQGVLALLAALPVALWLSFAHWRNPWRTSATALTASVLVAGIIVAFSRSALVAAMALLVTLAATLGRRRFGAWKTVAVMAAVIAVMGIVGLPYAKALVERAARGITSRDASYETRWYGFTVAWSLLPKYGLVGTGVGASDVAMREAADPLRLAGATLHSGPFKYWLELGIVGLAAYAWFWLRAARLVWRHLLKSDDPIPQRLGAALLGVFFACFLMLAVQPFTTLSLFPFLLGLAFGPIAARAGETRPSGAVPHRRASIVLAAVLVLVVVLPNVARYQAACRRVSHFADTLDAGPRAERRGAWSSAEETYSRALEMASGEATACPLSKLPYYATAAAVAELDVLFPDMAIVLPDPDPRAACAFARGRVRAASGDTAGAVEDFGAALDAESDFAEAAWAIAETRWASGDYADALDAYARARLLEATPRNAAFRDRMASVDSAIADLSREGTAVAGRVEAADLARRRGRWDEAVAWCREIIREHADVAQARFFLGIDAERRNDTAEAIAHYRAAIEAVPAFIQASERLAALQGKN